MSKKSSSPRARQVFSSEFKAKAALREDKTQVQLCQQYELHSNQISDWKRQLLSKAVEIIDGGHAAEPVDLAPLHAKIGQQALELDFLNSALTKAGLLSAGK